jgi:transposase
MNGKRQAEWRRNQVLELSSKGLTQSDISKILQISISTISRDLYFLREQAKDNLKKYINERLPAEYEKCLVGLTSILKEAWITSATEDKREKLQALSLAKECYSMKLELLTNATVVDDAITFVAEKQQESFKIKQNGDQRIKQQQDYDNRKITVNDVF